jgi:hypothetical protein
MKTILASVLAVSIATSGPADASVSPTSPETARSVETSGPATDQGVQLASYFTFMRSFGRICYSDGIGWYYC